MSIFEPLIKDLKEKRLWPLALVLVLAIAAVPVLLAKSSTPQPIVPPAGTTTGTGTQAKIPSISVDTKTTKYALTGLSKRNPFVQQNVSTSTTTTASTTTPAGSTSTGTTGSTGPTGSTGTTGGGTGTTTTTTTTTTTSSTTPAVPIGLQPDEAYHVSLSITNPSGGFDTIDPLERVSIIPSAQQPLLIELGVLRGGHKVLFVVQPGTQVSGPGTCTPGPVNCQILALGQDQTEGLSQQGSTGVVPVGLFAVTKIARDRFASPGIADRVRKTASGAGLKLLGRSTLGALPLFQYDPRAGAVLDLRNLIVGGGG